LIVPPCPTLLTTDFTQQTLIPFTVFWDGIVEFGIPQGFFINFGTDFPPSNIFNYTDIQDVYQYQFSPLSNGTYNFQLIPYGYRNGSHLIVNDTCEIYSFILSNQLAKQFPYFETFDNGSGFWNAFGISSSWELGIANKSLITSTTNCWVTSLSSYYNANENSQVRSLVFDFSSLEVDPVIEMLIFWEIESPFDGATFQIEKNSDSIWRTIGNVRDPNNWYTSSSIISKPGGTSLGWTGSVASNSGSGGWVNASNILNETARVSHVVLRFAFASDSIINSDGFAFDNIRISLPDGFNGTRITHTKTDTTKTTTVKLIPQTTLDLSNDDTYHSKKSSSNSNQTLEIVIPIAVVFCLLVVIFMSIVAWKRITKRMQYEFALEEKKS